MSFVGRHPKILALTGSSVQQVESLIEIIA
jgi:hypothetical protein